MTWTNHDGLPVKRCRGMTLPQWCLPVFKAELPPCRGRRVTSAACPVAWCDVAKRALREKRRERKKTRLRRKLAPLVRRMVNADSRAMSARWTAYAELVQDQSIASPSRVMRHEPIDWSRFKLLLPQHEMSSADVFMLNSMGVPFARLNEAVRHADEQISRVITGAGDSFVEALRHKFSLPLVDPAPVVKRTD